MNKICESQNILLHAHALCAAEMAYEKICPNCPHDQLRALHAGVVAYLEQIKAMEEL